MYCSTEKNCGGIQNRRVEDLTRDSVRSDLILTRQARRTTGLERGRMRRNH